MSNFNLPPLAIALRRFQTRAEFGFKAAQDRVNAQLRIRIEQRGAGESQHEMPSWESNEFRLDRPC